MILVRLDSIRFATSVETRCHYSLNTAKRLVIDWWTYLTISIGMGTRLSQKKNSLWELKYVILSFRSKQWKKICCEAFQLNTYNVYLIAHFVLFGFQKAGVKISIRQLEILIESLDINKDGNIDYR